ncbi:MAG: CDP-diacylglycerol diphosphatase [Methylocystis sp.]|uniref:CDP-diacylglycerol diphosphatase n=1 Tax=Methylocystis sp. TaxID=1911079 RepID=UPI003DA4A93D
MSIALADLQKRRLILTCRALTIRPTDWGCRRIARRCGAWFGLLVFQQAISAWPSLASKVDRARGYAVIRSPSRERLDFIVTPTTRVEGIESATSAKESPEKVWLAACKERRLLDEAPKHRLAWSDVILAINSMATRSQDQLHIYLGCINQQLRSFLASEPISDVQK